MTSQRSQTQPVRSPDDASVGSGQAGSDLEVKHPRDVVISRARERLERQIDAWLMTQSGRLSAAEFVLIVSGVFGDVLKAWAHQDIEAERSDTTAAKTGK